MSLPALRLAAARCRAESWGEKRQVTDTAAALPLAGKANMATIEPSCTMDLFMGNATLWSNTTNETVHFDGLSVLKSSIAKLGELGLSQAGARILWISIEMAVFCNIKQYEKAAIATQFAVDTRNSTTDDHRFWGNLGLTFSWSSTERVLFTGVAHAGTMVYLHADRVHAQIRAMSPALKTYPQPTTPYRTQSQRGIFPERLIS